MWAEARTFGSTGKYAGGSVDEPLGPTALDVVRVGTSGSSSLAGLRLPLLPLPLALPVRSSASSSSLSISCGNRCNECSEMSRRPGVGGFWISSPSLPAPAPESAVLVDADERAEMLDAWRECRSGEGRIG